MPSVFRPARTSYGASAFAVIRDNGCVYADKTRFIETLERHYGPNVFLVRPRCFGKSVFATMLSCYYDQREAASFEARFGGTYIGAHPTPLAGRLHVVNFDFSGLASAPDLAQEFQCQVRSALELFAGRHPFAGAREVLEGEWTSVGSLVAAFLNRAALAFGHTICVIIDECDHLAVERFFRLRKEGAEGGVTDFRFLEGFYAALEAATKTAVYRVYLTGVTPLAMSAAAASLTVDDVTTDPLMATAWGLTEAEVRGLIRETVDLAACAMTEDEVFRRMKAFYGGWRFDEGAEEVLSCGMCLYYLRQLATRKREPAIMTDRSADGDVERMARILAHCGEADFGERLLATVLAGKSVALPRLSWSFDSGRRGALDRDDVLSLFVYLGYLTFSPESAQRLVCPNEAVREQFRRLSKRHREM